MFGSKTAGDAIIRAYRLHKVYRMGNTQVEALRGVDIEVYAGEFVAVMGPSGCGKSTLLNILGGLDEATSGEAYIAGECITSLSERERARLRREKIGFVFQSYDLLPLFTVQQNIEFPLAVAGVDESTRRARALEALQSVGLSEKHNALVDELSGGQKQRVAIARTLVVEPEVIFADEPTGSLDSMTGHEVLTLLRQAVADRGTTVVMVTHDLEDARAADRIVALRDGHVVQEVAA